MKRLKYFLQCYFTVLPYVFFGLFNYFKPRAIQHFSNSTLDNIDFSKKCKILNSKHILDVFPSVELNDIKIIGQFYDHRTGGTWRLLELALLTHVCQELKPNLIFEIGTFIGATTRLLALNSPTDCNIITLDLPNSLTAHEVGEKFLSTPEKNKIKQVSGDSKKFDYSPWQNKCDIVWVDGNHDYDFMVSDTNSALKLVKKGGWILWHDYRLTSWWSGVTRHLRELKKTYPDLVHFKGTSIAALQIT
jgi:hypothetical protein